MLVELLQKALRVGVTFSLSLALFWAGTVSAHAEKKYDQNKSIIVYGGFGYFDEVRLQWLNSFLRRDQEYSQKGQELEHKVKGFVREQSTRSLSRWSSHPIIFSSSDLTKSYEASTGLGQTAKSDMFREFENAYMLVLTGNFEHKAVFSADSKLGTSYSPYTMVGVSASLVDLLGQHEIVLSASDVVIVQDEDNFRQSGILGDDEWADRFTIAYEKAAVGAIGSLFDLAKKANPRTISKSWETYMVTGANVLDPARTTEPATVESLKRVEDVFEWSRTKYPEKKGISAGWCKPGNYCKLGSEACGALMGFMVGATSKALSQAGYKVMPPPVWEKSTRKADQLARYRLRLPMSGLPELANSTPFVFSPERATYKVYSQLQGVTVGTGKSSKMAGWVADAYIANVGIYGARTQADNCSVTLEDAFDRDIQSAGAPHYDHRPISEQGLNAGSKQILNFIAIDSAFNALEEKLD